MKEGFIWEDETDDELLEPYKDKFASQCVSDIKRYHRRDKLAVYMREISWEVEDGGYTAEEIREDLLEEVERTFMDEAKNGALAGSAMSMAAIGPQLGDFVGGMVTASGVIGTALSAWEWRNSRSDAADLYGEIRDNMVIEEWGDRTVMYFDSES